MPRLGLVPLFHPFGGRSLDQRDLWDLSSSSSRLLDQHFGLGINEDDLWTGQWTSPSSFHNFYNRLGPARRGGPLACSRQLSTATNQTTGDPSTFQVMMDVNQFGPDEISVKTVDKCVVISAKHQEKMDQYGFISRQFQRRYVLPDNVLPETVISSLSSEGILTIEAPVQALEEPRPNERVVPIARRDPIGTALTTGPATEPAVGPAVLVDKTQSPDTKSS